MKTVQEEHDEEVSLLTELEIELQTMIFGINNYELSTLFIKWQEQRLVCNEGFLKTIQTLLKEE